MVLNNCGNFRTVKCFLLMIVMLLITTPFIFASSGLSFHDCANADDTIIIGTEENWLCLKDPEGSGSSKENELCILQADGDLADADVVSNALKTYGQYFESYMTNKIGRDLEGDEGEDAAKYMAGKFFPNSGVACTNTYSFPLSDLYDISGNEWEDPDLEKLIEHVGVDRYRIAFNCGGFFNNRFVVQGSGEEIDSTGYDIKDIYYCTGGKWYDLEDSYEDFDTDGDNVPSLSSWDFDCDDNNPNSYSDVSMFSFAQKAGITAGAEICDDGVDNLCTENAEEFFGTEFFERYDEYDDLVAKYTENPWNEDIDNCELNPTACEEQCLFAGGKCSYLDYVDETSDPSATTTIGPEGIGGYCCGNNLYDDLGSTAESSAGVSNICVNQNFVTPDIAEFSEPISDGNGFQKFKNHQNQH
jgi:hypothetical protein